MAGLAMECSRLGGPRVLASLIRLPSHQDLAAAVLASEATGWHIKEAEEVVLQALGHALPPEAALNVLKFAAKTASRPDFQGSGTSLPLFDSITALLPALVEGRKLEELCYALYTMASLPHLLSSVAAVEALLSCLQLTGAKLPSKSTASDSPLLEKLQHYALLLLCHMAESTDDGAAAIVTAGGVPLLWLIGQPSLHDTGDNGGTTRDDGGSDNSSALWRCVLRCCTRSPTASSEAHRAAGDATRALHELGAGRVLLPQLRSGDSTLQTLAVLLLDAALWLEQKQQQARQRRLSEAPQGAAGHDKDKNKEKDKLARRKETAPPQLGPLETSICSELCSTGGLRSLTWLTCHMVPEVSAGARRVLERLSSPSSPGEWQERWALGTVEQGCVPLLLASDVKMTEQVWQVLSDGCMERLVQVVLLPGNCDLRVNIAVALLLGPVHDIGLCTELPALAQVGVLDAAIGMLRSATTRRAGLLFLQTVAMLLKAPEPLDLSRTAAQPVTLVAPASTTDGAEQAEEDEGVLVLVRDPKLPDSEEGIRMACPSPKVLSEASPHVLRKHLDGEEQVILEGSYRTLEEIMGHVGAPHIYERSRPGYSLPFLLQMFSLASTYGLEAWADAYAAEVCRRTKQEAGLEQVCRVLEAALANSHEWLSAQAFLLLVERIGADGHQALAPAPLSQAIKVLVVFVRQLFEHGSLQAYQ